MSNMSYCRHENTYGDLADVWDNWEWDASAITNEYEKKYRRRLIQLVREMHEEFDSLGTYNEPEEQ